MKKKPCRKCGNLFSPTAHQLRKSDYLCKDCRSAYEHAWRNKWRSLGATKTGGKMTREYHRNYEKEYFKDPEVRRRRAALMKQYRNNPELRMRHEARWLTARAIRNGTLVRGACEVCGMTKVDAHHDDYAKPLLVKWLCRTHHSEHHAKAEGSGK